MPATRWPFEGAALFFLYCFVYLKSFAKVAGCLQQQHLERIDKLR
jgi:hypothetical protein